MKRIILTLICCLSIWGISAQNKSFDGLDVHMGNLFRLSDAKTRSICPENFTGEKGKGGMAQVCDRGKRNIANAAYAARDLGEGWKVNPYIIINPKETITIAEMEGPGAIQHIWMTPTGNWRFSIIRIYWDDEKEPSVECPVGYFDGLGRYAPLSSLAVCINPGSAFNCYCILNIINDEILALDTADIGIPLGSLFLPEFFSGKGPAIPVHILSIRNSDATFESNFSQAGINQTLHQLNMIVSVDVSVLVMGRKPLQTGSALPRPPVSWRIRPC